MEPIFLELTAKELGQVGLYFACAFAFSWLAPIAMFCLDHGCRRVAVWYRGAGF